MKEEYGFSPDGVTLSNLEELSVGEQRTAEARLYELLDVADAAAEFSSPLYLAEIGVPEMLSMLSGGITFGSGAAAENNDPAVLRATADSMRVTSVLDAVRFTELYLECMKSIGCRIEEQDLLGEPELGQVYGYVKNQFSDEAYDVLTEDLADPRVKYYKNFSECAAALARGEVDHILLPLEERGGVRLPTVSELIYRYDFKINSVTPVFGFGADADLKYAEISRRFRRSDSADDDDRYIELRVPAKDGAIADILAAASAFRMSVYRVNTHTMDTEGEISAYFSLVLREGDSDFAPLLTYLALFAADLIPVGVYKNLE